MSKRDQATYDLFVSYSDADRSWVDGYLLDALDAAQIHYISEETFALGAPRLLEFERAVQTSARSLLILSPAYLAENLAQFTDLLAQSFGLETATWPVIPLLLEPVDLPPRLAMLQSLDATDPENWAEVIEHLCAELERPVPGPAPKPKCPYPGMVPFREQDSDRFFGRDREIQDLLERLRLHPFVTVIGASGSGKSSLVFAGLVPALRSTQLLGTGEWLVRSLRPGEAPCNALVEALGSNVLEDPTQAVSTLLAPSPSTQHLLLIVDQFEETFTLSGQDSDLFQETILSLSQAANCYIVITVRADFYPDLMASPLWCEIQSHRLEILPMGEQALRQAIVQPAEDVGVFVETALVERLIADAASEPGILPLIQETLVLLWEKLERRYLPLDAYEALVLPRSAYDEPMAETPSCTGLQVAMARRADAALAELSEQEQTIARRIFLRLIQFGEGRADTRRRLPVSRLYGTRENEARFAQTLGHLVDNRLLTISGQAQDLERTVDIAHEALISGWPTLAGWIEERRGAEQTRRRLESKAAEWLRLERRGGILEEIELMEAEQWLSSSDAAELDYDSALVELVQSSREAIEAEKAERERARQRELESARRLAEEAAARERVQREAASRLRKRAWMLTGIGAVAIALAILGFYLFRDAARTRQIAQSRALAAQAIYYADSDAQKSLQLALAAVDQSQTVQAQNALRQALLATYRSRALTGHTDAVRALAWSPDGTRFASAGFDHTVRIWHADTGETITTLIGHDGPIRGVAWSADGLRLATAAFDNTIRIWEIGSVASSQILRSTVLSGHTGSAYSVAWSPDGALLASSASDGTVRLWDPETGANIVTLNEDAGEINKVAWSPDGTHLAYAADDQTVRIWSVSALLARAPGTEDHSVPLDPNNPREYSPIVLSGHRDFVMDVAWSPDGTQLASASADGTVRTWDAINGTPLDTLVGHRGGWVYSVGWSPDGKQLVSTSDDTTVRIWDVGTGTLAETLTGHSNWVYDARWSPDGSTLISASLDGTIHVWDLVHPSTTILEAHTGEVQAVAWSPDGKWLVSGGDDKAVRSWYAGADYAHTLLVEHSERIVSLDWQPGGNQIVYMGLNGTVGLWDAGQVITRSVFSSRSRQVAWNPDGTSVATVSAYDGVRFFTLEELRAGALPEQTAERGPADIDQLDLMSVAWHPDGQQIATGARDGTITLWDVASREPISVLTGHSDFVWKVAWNPRGTRLASASQDGTIRIWNTVHPDKQPVVLQEHERAVNDVAWSPDGTTIASASDDATVRLWDPDHPHSLAILTGPDKGIWSVAWTPDGQRLAAAAMDGTVWVMYAQFDQVLDIAHRLDVPPLTTDELAIFLGKD